MLHAVLFSIFLQFAQTDYVEFSLLNDTSEVLYLEIQGFRRFSLPENSMSDFRLQAGQEVYYWKDADGDGTKTRFRLLTVEPDMQGNTLKADKLIKESGRNIDSRG